MIIYLEGSLDPERMLIQGRFYCNNHKDLKKIMIDQRDENKNTFKLQASYCSCRAESEQILRQMKDAELCDVKTPEN